MKIFTIIIAVLAFSGCKEASDFVQTNCEVLNHDVLMVQFSNENAMRTISVNPNENAMTFKGTTYQDMKWATEIDKVKAFTINTKNMFLVSFKDGQEFQFGKVNLECKEKIAEHLGDLLQPN